MARPDSLSNLNHLLPLADVATTWYVDAARFHGAALYRAGRFEEALRCFQEVQRLHTIRSWDWAFLAMTHYRLDHPKEASQCLIDGERWIKEADQLAEHDVAHWPSWEAWYQRPIALNLMDEARAMIHPQPSQRSTKSAPLSSIGG